MDRPPDTDSPSYLPLHRGKRVELNSKTLIAPKISLMTGSKSEEIPKLFAQVEMGNTGGF